MALANISLYSDSLKRTTDVRMILPCDMRNDGTRISSCYQRLPKLLILLHGYTGSNTDWLLSSPILELAAKYNLIVAFPSGENSFYLNQAGTGRAYGDFIGSELITLLRNTFVVDGNGEDTIIGGFSMGGFGALHVGLSYPEYFSNIIALSSALIQYQVADMKPNQPLNTDIADYDYYAATFGKPSEVPKSTNNPEVLVSRLLKSGKPLPRIFMACGSEDFLIEPNRRFHNFLEQNNVSANYHESEGVHNSVFCNKYLEPGIRWALRIE